MSTVAIVAVLFIELCSFAGIKHRIPDVASQRFTQREKFDTKSCTLHRNELHPTESPLVCHQTLIDADITTAGVYFWTFSSSASRSFSALSLGVNCNRCYQAHTITEHRWHVPDSNIFVKSTSWWALLKSSLTVSTIRVLLVLLQKHIFIVSCDVCYISFILAL